MRQSCGDRAGDPRSGKISLPNSLLQGIALAATYQTLAIQDEIKRRIGEAAKYVDVDQLCLSPQCGFASTEEGKGPGNNTSAYTAANVPVQPRPGTPVCGTGHCWYVVALPIGAPPWCEPYIRGRIINCVFICCIDHICRCMA